MPIFALMDLPKLLPEISSRADIERLVTAFYARLMKNRDIGHFFTQVVELDLAKHIPRIVDFWESILFQSGGYDGDPMAVHINLNKRSPMEAGHFGEWVLQFCTTVDEMYSGEKAELAKQRAYAIASLMQVKIKRGALG